MKQQDLMYSASRLSYIIFSYINISSDRNIQPITVSKGLIAK